MNIKSNKFFLKSGTFSKNWVPTLWALILFTACKKEKTPEPAANNITFSLQLADVKAVILYNDSITFINQNESEWAIYIDSDSDSTTGNPEGFDVKVGMTYFKESNTPLYGGILSYTQKKTWILEKFASGSMATSAHNLTASIDEVTNCLLLTGNKNWPEMARVDAGDRMKVETYYLYERDESTVGKFPDDILDIQGDVTLPFIDIVSLKIIQ